MKRTLRVCTTTVSTDGLAEPNSNEERIALARELIESYGRHRIADLVVLPAGYLRARSEAEVLKVATPIIDAARKVKVAVILGVDSQDAPAAVAREGRPRPDAARRPEGPTTQLSRVRRGALPYFLVAWSPKSPKPIVWRQRSATHSDAREAPAGQVSQPRLLPVKTSRVAALACGEIFSAPIRRVVAEHVPDLAVLAAHRASGARHWAAQRSLAGLGVPSLRSVHAKADARDVLTWRDDRLPWMSEGFPRVRPGAPFKARLLASVHHVDCHP
jgi:hypothetical protein